MTNYQKMVIEFCQRAGKVTMSGIKAALPELTENQVSSAVGELRRTGRIVRVDRGGNTATYELRADPKLPIAEQCRQNWSGYHIHKIFGSAGRVTA